jgi:drug/metabolite transporter (DMT)-like permease
LKNKNNRFDLALPHWHASENMRVRLTRKMFANKAMLLAMLAALLYAISAPFSKLLLGELPTTLLAAFLYLGAGIGILLVYMIGGKVHSNQKELPLGKKDIPYVVGMVLLDVAAPISLMLGLSMTSAANASLLNNFEIVATSLIAFVLFRETISKRVWLAIIMVTIASIMISVNDTSSFDFSKGSFLVILACIFWGFENNCTRMLADKNPNHIVIIKGFCSGGCSLLLGMLLGERASNLRYILMALVLGFVSYGLSIFCYIHAQRLLGASKTSTFYAIAPFFGAILALVIFKELPKLVFIFAFLLMLYGAYLATTENTNAQKSN